MSTLEVNAIDKESGSTLTLGGSGTQVTVHASATTSGFPSSGLQSIQYIYSSGTWTKPSGITKVRVFVTGGGGSGSTNSSAHNSGGWGGGTAIKFIDVSSISSATVTVGAGGTANTSASSTGQDGGDSVWNDGTNVLTGGGGKGEGSWSSSASGGDFNIPGDGGGSYLGGSSYWANRSHASHTISSSLYVYASTSDDTTVAGLGQGGLAYYSSGVTGYAGGAGIIVVEEYA